MAASYISVPRDLTKVKSRIIFGLTKRQLICFTVAALIGVPSFFFIRSVAEVNVAVMSMMVIMMPIIFFALYEKNGRPLEVYLGHFIEAVFVRPRKRPYKTDNYYSALERTARAEREVRKIVRSSMEKK
ncbi:PrgI family protein [Butyrivibrio sp.]|uniref:PrgI family protein n=1 Tax=Butyrivibrio sp. TaxID=28121 RepID=UPI0025BA4498|nr:PrgI family protein [Butyrivibrio sp.]MBQ9301813.1 PrgI family protein [Butyrivibrio sp.]